MKHTVNIFLLVIAVAQLSGCASLGKGIAEAFLEKQQEVDTEFAKYGAKPLRDCRRFWTMGKAR